MADSIAIIVGETRHEGWTSARVVRALDQVAGAFSVALTNKWAPDAKRVPIAEGEPCEVRIGDQTVIRGHVDEVEAGYSGSERGLRIDGRSRSADLVDCSAIHSTSSWKDAPSLQIAKELCEPFKLGVSAELDLSAPLASFAIEQGETVFEALERLARLAGCLVSSDAQGEVVFTRAGTQRAGTSLELGRNILRGSLRSSSRDRFSEYTVKGQTAGSDDTSGDATSNKARATDDAVKRHRPLLVLAEDQLTAEAATTRANWERGVRAGRARRWTYIVTGWHHAPGKVWAPNLLVQVKDPSLELDGDRLVVAVTLSLDANGQTTELQLVAKSAFDVQPPTGGA